MESDERIRSLSDEELEHALEIRDRYERNLASGRPLGAQANRDRAAEHRAHWYRIALEVLRDQPYLWGNFGAVAEKVAEWCRVRSVSLRSGRAYKVATIHRALVAARSELRTRLHR